MASCTCKSGDARNPNTHNNQVRQLGRCWCECHAPRSPQAPQR